MGLWWPRHSAELVVGLNFDHTLRGQITVNRDVSGAIAMHPIFTNYCSMALGYLNHLAKATRGGFIFTGKCTTGGYADDGHYFKYTLSGSFNTLPDWPKKNGLR